MRLIKRTFWFGIGTMSMALCPLLNAPSTAIAAEIPKRLLVVTVTEGFRHGSIETAEPVLEELGRTTGLYRVDFLKIPMARPSSPKQPKREAGTSDEDWKKTEEVFKSESEAARVAEGHWRSEIKNRFAKAFDPESLKLFDGIIFANTTGDDLPIPDMNLFLEWIRSGKAFIGMHAATDTLKKSDGYRDLVGGAFAGHPWGGGGEHAFVVHEPNHRLSSMFPERFRWKDEIYQYDMRFDPGTVRVLLSLDMSASTPKEPWHVPVSWVREYGKGRVFYTNLGHNDATWKDDAYRKHLTEGIAWAVGNFDVLAEPNPHLQADEYIRSVVAAAAPVINRNADELRAKVDAKIAADQNWALSLRPMLIEGRTKQTQERLGFYANVIAEVDKP